MAKTTNGAQNDATAQPLANLLAPLLEIADHTEAGPLDTPTWRVLATRAVRERLGALLHAALQQTSRTDVPGDVQAMLAHVHCRAAAAALYQQQELAAILRWCAAADIPCIVLKGSALAVTLYADPALRPCGDLDLLFAPGAIPQVGEMLGANGYVNRYGQRAGRLPRATSELHFSRCGPRPVIVEPHWHITSNPYYVRRMPVAWFWQQTATATIGGAAAWVLAPPAQFLHLVAHYYLHAQGRHLLWSFDIALLLARCAATWDWDALAVQAERFGLGLFARTALIMAEREWGVAVPAVGAAALNRTRSNYGERVAVWAMARPGAPPWVLWQAVQTPSPRLRLHLLARLVLPSRAGVRRFWRGTERGRMARAYLWRILRLPAELRGVWRQLWALWRGAQDRVSCG